MGEGRVSKGSVLAPCVQLIYDSDCPNVDEARREIAAALREQGLPELWEESQQETGKERFGSPTVMVNGRDVEPDGSARRANQACRIYVDGNRIRYSPSRDTIRKALQSLRPGVGIQACSIPVSSTILPISCTTRTP